MNINNWLEVNKKDIIHIIDLEDVQSKSDPSEQPYKSQYAARDILQTNITNLDELMTSFPNDCNGLTYLVFLSLSYRLANNFLSTEERHSGEEIINLLYDKIGSVPHINAFIQQLQDKPEPVGDSVGITESGEYPNLEDITWIRSIAGILLKIYNTRGMLWASKIINHPQESSSAIDDPGFLNSFKYLNMAKKLYKTYKCRLRKAENKHDYDPPECLDSVLLSVLNYETPYLKFECGLLENIRKNEAIKLDIFESDYTSTLFLLAQAFGKMSSVCAMKHRSAKYCYKTLSRQLNSLKYDPVEWALNAATLSQYYVTEKGFKRARHCIAASEQILKEASTRPTFDNFQNNSTDGSTKTDTTIVTNTETGENDSVNGNSGASVVQMDCKKTVDNIFEESVDSMIDEISQKKCGANKMETNPISEAQDVKTECEDKTCKEETDEDIKRKKLFPDPMSESRFWDDDVYEEKREQAKADIDRCWIKYGLTILEDSYDRFMPEDVSNVVYENDDIKFPEFNVELDSVEKQVTCAYVNTFDEARDLFLFVQKKLNEARKYYRIDNRCSDAIELICDHSKAFKALSNFENSVERKCCMHKKRLDMLTDLLNTLNQNYYQVACRTMMLEVGEIYSTMMSLKASLIETTSPQDAEAMKVAKGVALKMRRLAQSGIEMYTKFLDSYRNRDGIMPEIFAEDDIRPIMIANLYMGRMYSKIIEPNMTERTANLRKSLDRYQFIVSYCDRHANAAQLMAGELESCRDMATLLPHKIHKLLN